MELAQFDEALKYLNLALVHTDSEYSRRSIQSEMTNVYNAIGEHEKALEIAIENSKYCIERKITNDLFCLFNKYLLAETYHYLKKKELAIKHLNNMPDTTFSNDNKIAYYLLLGHSYYKINQANLASTYRTDGTKQNSSSYLQPIYM